MCQNGYMKQNLMLRTKKFWSDLYSDRATDWTTGVRFLARAGDLLLKPFRSAPGPTSYSYSMGTTHFHLVLKWQVNSVIFPLSLYVFMAAIGTNWRLSGSFHSVHVNWYTFLFVRETTAIIILEILGATTKFCNVGFMHPLHETCIELWRISQFVQVICHEVSDVKMQDEKQLLFGCRIFVSTRNQWHGSQVLHPAVCFTACCFFFRVEVWAKQLGDRLWDLSQVCGLKDLESKSGQSVSQNIKCVKALCEFF